MLVSSSVSQVGTSPALLLETVIPITGVDESVTGTKIRIIPEKAYRIVTEVPTDRIMSQISMYQL